MTTTILRTLLAGAALLVGGTAAQAFCIDLSDATLLDNDVALTGCAATGGPGEIACDMNGFQGSGPTHGVFGLDQVSGRRFYRWTRNGVDSTEEYTCRIDPDGSSEGAVHIFTGQAFVDKDYKTFRCRTVEECFD